MDNSCLEDNNLIVMERKTDRISLTCPRVSGQELKFVQEAFDTNWVVPLGPNVNGFEEDLTKYVNKTEEEGVELTRSVAALASGEAAVHLALVAIGVGRGDEVICQSFAICASADAVSSMGATPVSVDSEKDSWNMDPELLEEAIRDRITEKGKAPKAIIVGAICGMPYQVDKIMEIAERYEIPVIEDTAKALGSLWKGQKLGTFGEYGVYSFSGSNIITTSEGGAIICRTKESRDRILWYATQARESYPYYQHEAIGYNYRLSNVSAGIGRGQMLVLDENLAHHRKLAALYEDTLKDIKGITFHKNPDECFESNYWLNVITIDPALRMKGQEEAFKNVEPADLGSLPNANVEAMRKGLDAMNIETRPLWLPIHKQPLYLKKPACVNGVAESLYKTGLCLPSGADVTPQDVKYIVEVLSSLIITE